MDSPTLWMINHYAELPNRSGGVRHYNLCAQLNSLGWDARLIRSSGTRATGFNGVSVERVGSVEVTSLAGLKLMGGRSPSRIASWLEFSTRLLLPSSTAHLSKPDVIVGSTVHLPAAWAARALARRHECPFVFEVRDLWPETLIAMGALKASSPAARGMRRLEGSLARSADLIVSPLPFVGEYMQRVHGVSKDRFAWVSNGVNFADFAGSTPYSGKELRLQYLGALGYANDVFTIVGAVKQARALSAVPISMRIIGTGTYQHELEELARGLGYRDWLQVLPEIPSNQVPKAMAWGNAVIFSVRDLPDLYRYGISPNKAFGFLASGQWIIMGANVPGNPIDGAPGSVVAPPTEEGLRDAVVRTAHMDGSERLRLSSLNRAIAQESFDFAVLGKKLSDHLAETLRSNSHH